MSESFVCVCVCCMSVQGHAESLSNLGTMYDQGLGVLRDEAEAKRCWNRAAAHGITQVSLVSTPRSGHSAASLLSPDLTPPFP